ncbi:MAG: hypothetical protein LBN11_05950 [Tannerella sp.]|jgi:hypothetical protein|nr:hypothetical protein [Tannerella sp.]
MLDRIFEYSKIKIPMPAFHGVACLFAKSKYPSADGMRNKGGLEFLFHALGIFKNFM